jgi:hypothetical protein
MTISYEQLMYAILTMDSYNRGYDADQWRINGDQWGQSKLILD